MAIPGIVVGKGEDRGMGTWSGHLSPLQTKPGSVFSVSLEHGSLLLREAVQWGLFLNGSCGYMLHPEVLLVCGNKD